MIVDYGVKMIKRDKPFIVGGTPEFLIDSGSYKKNLNIIVYV